jgi:type II secretory pathway component PulF
MALYFYQAFSKEGKKISGTLDAPSESAVREHLGAIGAYPINIQLTNEAARGAWWQRIFGPRVSLKQKILFTKQFAVLLKSGVPLLQARLKTIIITLKDDIKGGSSLAAALARYPRIYDNIYVQLVRAGEASGKLELILDRLVTYLERRAAIRSKIQRALMYPAIQLTVILIITAALITQVVPQLVENLPTGGELPWNTQLLMSIADLLQNHYLILITSIILLVIAFKYWRSTKSGARLWDFIKLKLPIIGYFTRIGAVVEFSRTLGILIESGVNLAESLDIVVKIINNRILADSLSAARDNIIKQGRIADYLQKTGLFPSMAIYLIKTGEESGKLDSMLLTVAQNYEDDLSEYAGTLSTILDPVMLLLMGVIVGFVVFAIMGVMQTGQNMEF